MAKISEIVSFMEEFAPPSLTSSWDNSGWQIYLGDKDINRVMLGLTPTPEVIEQALEKRCELIIAHHPLIFSKVNKLNVNNSKDIPVIKALQNNLPVYSAHTNLDSTKGGIADELAKIIGLKNLTPIEKISEDTGLGRIGELEKEETLDVILSRLKQALNADKLKVINRLNKTKAKSIALCPGSGGSFIPLLNDVDLYITGDIKYHDAIEINNLVVIDAGHFETERIILPILKNMLEKLGIEIFIAEETDPWNFV